MIRSDEERTLLWDLQLAIGALPEAHHPRLLGIYHALLRRWAVV